MDVLFKKHFWLINLVAVGLCAGLGGAGAAHLVEQGWLLGAEESQQAAVVRPHAPPPAERVHSKDEQVVIQRNVFCSACKPVEEKAADLPEDVKGKEILKTSLPLELVATMWVENDPKWSMAVIRDTGSKEKDAHMYNAGKLIDGTPAEVVRVDPRKVYIKNGGRFEYLEIEGPGAEKKAPETPAPAVAAAGPTDPLDNDVQRGVRCSGNNCDVDRSLIDKLLANTTALATAARFVPSVKDGRPNGFKLYAIRPNSIFAKLGLQNGDTVKSINGMEMASPDQALAIYSKLRTASHLSVSVERRGETVTLDDTIR